MSEQSKPLPLENSVTRAIGELFVLAQLRRMGYTAVSAHGTPSENWDIALLNDAGENIKVQVMTIDWPEHRALNGNFENGFHILVVVLLDRAEENPRYIVTTPEEIAPHLSPRNPARGDLRTLSLGLNFTEDPAKKSLKVDAAAWKHFRELVRPVFE